MQYSYDNYERLAQENRDGDITSYTYNLAGQLTEITDTTGKYTYYYDSIGRVTRMVYPDGGNLKPVYDKDNRLTAVHTNLGGTQRTTGYTYLLDGRLSQTTLPTGKTVTYSYDPLARLSGSGIDGVLSSSYTYESPGEGKTTPLVSSVTTNGKETEYTYDAFGNILTITEDGVLQHSYTYDARNQLVGETSGTDSYVYSYDAGGNLVSVQKNGEVIKSYTYGDASWKDLLTAFNGQSITYDAIGNPLSYRGMTLSWEGGRRLASVSKEGLSASYVYNAGGIRTQKTVNGVTANYYLDGNSILRQVTGNDVLEFFYDANGVLGFYYNNTPYYYLKNLQGDIVGILDANGTQVVSYTYDAWGAPLSVTGTAADTIGQINPFRYRSYYYDNETGLYYLNSRYYDPETYRFLNVDSVIPATGNPINGYNLFAYCLNNPLVYEDAAGEFPNIIKRIVNVVKFFYNTAMAFVKAVEVNAGGGIGLGASVSANYDGVSIGVDATIKSSDSVRVNRKGISGQHESSVGAGVSVAVFNWSIRHGVEHSYQNPNCSCNWFDSSFKEKMECPANEPILLQVEDPKIEFGVGAYLVLGGEVSVSINLREVEENLYAIFEDTMEYED